MLSIHSFCSVKPKPSPVTKTHCPALVDMSLGSDRPSAVAEIGDVQFPCMHDHHISRCCAVLVPLRISKCTKFLERKQMFEETMLHKIASVHEEPAKRTAISSLEHSLEETGLMSRQS
jgi:hypothetical protein